MKKRFFHWPRTTFRQPRPTEVLLFPVVVDDVSCKLVHFDAHVHDGGYHVHDLGARHQDALPEILLYYAPYQKWFILNRCGTIYQQWFKT
jgi:hypothetical protein